MADQAQRAAATAGGHLFADRDGRICYRDDAWLRSDPRAVNVQAVIANVDVDVPDPDPVPVGLTWGLDELTWGLVELTWGAVDPVPVAGHLCATGIVANGPDMERLVNVVVCSGVDDALPEDDPVEVTRRDTPSEHRYGPASFTVDQLYTRDPAQLALLGSRVIGLRSSPACGSTP